MVLNAEGPQQIHSIRPVRFEWLMKNLLMDMIRGSFRCDLYVTRTMAQLFGKVPPQPPEVMYGWAAIYHIFARLRISLCFHRC